MIDCNPGSAYSNPLTGLGVCSFQMESGVSRALPPLLTDESVAPALIATHQETLTRVAIAGPGGKTGRPVIENDTPAIRAND